MEKVQNDLSQKFSKGTIIIHWLTVILIFALFPLGKYMEGLEPSEKLGLVKIHAMLGISVFILTAIRTWLFFKAPRPAELKTGSAMNDKLIIWVRNAFYFLLFAITISGSATMILGGYGDALSSDNAELILNRGDIAPLKGHGLLAFTLMLLFVMHLIGIIKHYFLMKENALKRMLPW